MQKLLFSTILVLLGAVGMTGCDSISQPTESTSSEVNISFLGASHSFKIEDYSQDEWARFSESVVYSVEAALEHTNIGGTVTISNGSDVIRIENQYDSARASKDATLLRQLVSCILKRASEVTGVQLPDSGLVQFNLGKAPDCQMSYECGGCSGGWGCIARYSGCGQDGDVGGCFVANPILCDGCNSNP